jgi:hypothetical protein
MATDYGTIEITLPFNIDDDTVNQNFINYYDSGLYVNPITTKGQTPSYPYSDPIPSGFTNNGVLTGYTGTTYLGIGSSRIEEKRKYGSNSYDTTTFTYGTNSDGIKWTGYTFTYTGETMSGETLQYVDYEDGYTMITGTTYGFKKEHIFDAMLTRNEHFLGFVEQPTIYSDIFVERGKMGVMEMNLRLGEVDNMGELSVYGNGFFKIKKQ